MEQKDQIRSQLSSLIHYINHEDLPMVQKRLADCLLVAEPQAKIISSNLMLAESCPSSEDIKRWYALLVGKGEKAMLADMQKGNFR